MNKIGSSSSFVYCIGCWSKLSKNLKISANEFFKLNVAFPRWGCMEFIYWDFIDRISG